MAEPLDFEVSLERRLGARAAAASRPFDASGIAATAVAARPRRRLDLTSWTGRWGWAIAVAATLLAILAGALVAGALLRDRQLREPLLAVARADGIYLTHEDGSIVSRLAGPGINPTRGSGPMGFAWSADGALLLDGEVAQNGDDQRLTVYRLDGSVAWTTDGTASGAWSHHGHRVAWFAPDATVVVTDVDTGQRVPVTSDGNGFAGTLSWSPDDSRLLMNDRRGNNLLIVPLDGGASMRFAPGEQNGQWVQDPAWSPDGRLVAASFVCENCPTRYTIAIFDARTGQQVDSVSPGGLEPMWSPDSTRLAWDPTDGTVVVGTLPLAGGSARVVLPGSGYELPAGWTPDGALLMLVLGPLPSDAPDLWRVELDGTDPVRLATGVTAAAIQPMR